MKASLPSRIMVVSRLSDRPLPGALVELELPMTRKNSFRLLFGPAAADGSVTIVGDEISAKVAEERNLFPMDYAGLEQGWTGEVVVRAVDRSAVERLRHAFETWGSVGSWPAKFPALLDDLEGRLAEGGEPNVIAVSVEVAPGDALVRVDRVKLS